MKNQGSRSVRISGAFCVSTFLVPGLLLPSARAEDAWSVWSPLSDLYGRTIAVALSDGRCIGGKATGTGDDLIVKTPEWHSARDYKIITEPSFQVEVRRAETLRISQASSPPRIEHLLYSGRSSWSDVGEITPVERERVLVTMKDGKQIRGKPTGFSADYIQIEKRRISKAEVRTVEYLRYKPLTADQEYLYREYSSWMDVRLWFHAWLVPMVRVLVFDAAVPEDNSPICSKTPVL